MNKRDIQISKTLSYLLRHGGFKEGLAVRSDGYVRLQDVLSRAQFRGVTTDDIERIVRENDKQRFELQRTPEYFIRARQGHSLANVADTGLERITTPTEAYAIHGTFLSLKQTIAASPGLSRMQRHHVHMTTPQIAFGPRQQGVSGVRASADLFYWINLSKLLKHGIDLYRSSNGVLLSPGDEHGIVPWSCIDRATDRAQNTIADALPSAIATFK